MSDQIKEVHLSFDFKYGTLEFNKVYEIDWKYYSNISSIELMRPNPVLSALIKSKFAKCAIFKGVIISSDPAFYGGHGKQLLFNVALKDGHGQFHENFRIPDVIVDELVANKKIKLAKKSIQAKYRLITII